MAQTAWSAWVRPTIPFDGIARHQADEGAAKSPPLPLTSDKHCVNFECFKNGLCFGSVSEIICKYFKIQKYTFFWGLTRYGAAEWGCEAGLQNLNF